MSSRSCLLRATANGVVAMSLLAACCDEETNQPSDGTGPGPGPDTANATDTIDTADTIDAADTAGTAETTDPSVPQTGGTIYVLTQAEQWNHVDPQRIYTGADLAFFSGTLQRSLTAFQLSADAQEGTSLVPDMATDLGTAKDGGKTWSFTLRDGITWQDGSDVRCEDVKYGVSRTFATDVIGEGPTYAIQYLDIPTDEDGSSAYEGPYTEVGQALYDEAVVCDGKTITFHLSRPVADFNYTVTLGFSAVPATADTGETYGSERPYVMSNGPYQVDSYTTGSGGKMILVRNPSWNPASDPYRKAYPDRWEVHFGIDPKVMDQRIMQSSGEDATAIQYGSVQPENLSTIFADPETPTADFEGRAVSGFDPYTRYFWIDVNKVPNVKIRQAMAVALDREAMRLNVGGAFAGDFADGLLKPSIGADYAPTGFYTDFFGSEIPADGDPELAKQLIAESGEPAPALVFNFADTPTNQRTAAIVVESLGRAGLTVTPAPIEPGMYYATVFDPEASGDFGTGGWGPDWPNASTVLPPLLTIRGGWDLSKLDDPAVDAAVEAALSELDRPKQQKLWQALNRQASENVWILPTFFGRTQIIAGTNVRPIYQWAAYGAWPYGEMYVVR